MAEARHHPFGLTQAVMPSEASPAVGVTTTWVEGQLVKDDEFNSALYPASSRFPLGRPFGLVPTSTGGTAPSSMPFGLRLAIVHPATPVGDLSRYGYDTDRQIGIVRDGDAVTPLLKHTDGYTRTVTHPDGHRGNDTDQDVRED